MGATETRRAGKAEDFTGKKQKINEAVLYRAHADPIPKRRLIALSLIFETDLRKTAPVLQHFLVALPCHTEVLPTAACLAGTILCKS